MYSVCDNLTVGFPHSEISGSKLICQLPEAYRRLSRPSSPIIAKASTTCSYSLDPITLTPQKKPKQFKECLIGLSPIALCRIQIHTNFRPCNIEYSLTQSKMLLAARCALNLYECALSTSNADFRLYEFLKNSRSRPCPEVKQRCCPTTKYPDQTGHFVFEHLWWRMTGSNRRPPACKAGALPAELIPHKP